MKGKSRLFDSGGRIYRILSTAWQLICLQILTLAGCIPIITAGASITAMHYCLLKIIRSEESYLSRDFFRSFKENLLPSTLLWLIKLAFLIPLAADLLLLGQDTPALPRPVAYVALIAGFLVMMLLSFCFPLQSHFENTLPHTLGNSIRLALYKIPRAFVMTFVWIVPAWIAVHVFMLFPLVLLMGLSLPGYICARMADPVFRELESSAPSA